MLTYEDLLTAGDDPIKKGEMAESAVNQFMSSREYKEAQDGYAYYDKHNATIERYEKTLRTITGRVVPDYWSANYKIKTLIFRRLITQQVQYVMGNGLQLDKPKDKEKLGKDFDFKLQTAAKEAMAGGVAFGFWNYDHLEVFGYADTPSRPGFCPLKSEEDASVRAGVRFWFKETGDTIVSRYTLYEEDGYTEYVRNGTEEMQVLQPKRGYKIKTSRLQTGEIVDICEENYGRLPIVPLYANDTHESELIGIRESIDCYDMIKSGMADVIDDTSEIFWLIKNSGGMDDIDLSQLIQRIRTTHAAVADADGGGDIAPQVINVPTDSRQAMLEILRQDIYEDFQSLDVKTLSAAAKTTQEIQAAYQSMDNKCADFEYSVLDFVQNILDIAGLGNDTPSFIWNRVINMQEQTSVILSAAQYLTEEMVIRKLPFLTPEEAEEVIKQRQEEAQDQFAAQGAADDGSDGQEGMEDGAGEEMPTDEGDGEEEAPEGLDDDEDEGSDESEQMLDDFEAELDDIFNGLDSGDDDEEPEEDEKKKKGGK